MVNEAAPGPAPARAAAASPRVPPAMPAMASRRASLADRLAAVAPAALAAALAGILVLLLAAGVSAIQGIRIDPIPGLSEEFIRGVDISTLEKVEHYGGRYFEYGEEKDLLDILKGRGVNWVRLRVWNDPVLDEGFSGPEGVVRMARRVKEKGFKLLVDFHYSDHWADPGKQNKPAAWEGLDFPQLKQAVYDFTYDVIAKLRDASALPDMVQIGNEIRTGMLWPDGKLGTPPNAHGSDFDRLAELLKAGIRAVHEAAGEGRVKIALHLDDGGNNSLYRWWFDQIVQRGVPFDVIGLSYYPYWHGTLAQLKANMNDISRRYGKDVAVFETAYGFTFSNADGHPNIFGPEQARIAGFPVSVQGQADAVRAVMEAVAQVPDGRGLGVFYWEPAWLGIRGAGWTLGAGNAWENQAMFDFQGNALDSLYVFAAVLEPVPVAAPALRIVREGGGLSTAELPSRVEVLFSDGSVREMEVRWRSGEEAPTAGAASAQAVVRGSIEGTGLPVELVIANPE